MKDYEIYLMNMRNCVKEANLLINKANSYKKYSDKLLEISNIISSISTDLSDSNSLFCSGGYVDNGEGLYQSRIITTSTNALSLSNNIIILSNKTLDKINDMKIEYDGYKTNYENNKTSFYNCEKHIGFVPIFPEFKY